MPASVKIDVPQSAPFVQATLLQSHARVQITPNDDESLAYELMVPKTWALGKEFGPVGSGPLMERGIGIFAGGLEPRAPVIAVTVMQSPFEIPLDAWARANLAHEGWEVVSAFWFPGAVGLYFDITATRVVADQTEVRRTSVRSRGSDVFSVNCMCGLESYEAAKEYFWVAHATFEVLSRSDAPMEPLLEARVMDSAPEFVVAHPASWLVEPVQSPPEGVSALDVRLVDAAAEQLLGYVQVKAEAREKGAPAPTLEERKSEVVLHLSRSGIIAKEDSFEPLTEENDPRSIAVDGWVGGIDFVGEVNGNQVALTVGFVDRGAVAVTFTLLGPLPSADLLGALRCRRVFEITRATLEL